MQQSYNCLWSLRLLLLASAPWSLCRPTTSGKIQDLSLCEVQALHRTATYSSYHWQNTLKEPGLLRDIRSLHGISGTAPSSMVEDTSAHSFVGSMTGSAHEQSHDYLVGFPHGSLATESRSMTKDTPIEAGPVLGIDHFSPWLCQPLTLEPERIAKMKHIEGILRAGHIHEGQLNQKEDLCSHPVCNEAPLVDQSSEKQERCEFAPRGHKRVALKYTQACLSQNREKRRNSCPESDGLCDHLFDQASKCKRVNDNMGSSAGQDNQTGIPGGLRYSRELEYAQKNCFPQTHDHTESPKPLQEILLRNPPTYASEIPISRLERVTSLESTFILDPNQDFLGEESSYGSFPNNSLRNTEKGERPGTKSHVGLVTEHGQIIHEDTEIDCFISDRKVHNSQHYRKSGRLKEFEHTPDSLLRDDEEMNKLLNFQFFTQSSTELPTQNKNSVYLFHEIDTAVSYWTPPELCPSEPVSKHLKTLHRDIEVPYQTETTKGIYQPGKEKFDSQKIMSINSNLYQNNDLRNGNNFNVEHVIRGDQIREYSNPPGEVSDIDGILINCPSHDHRMLINEIPSDERIQESLNLTQRSVGERLNFESKVSSTKSSPKAPILEQRNHIISSSNEVSYESWITETRNLEESGYKPFGELEMKEKADMDRGSSKKDHIVTQGESMKSGVLNDDLNFIQFKKKDRNKWCIMGYERKDERDLTWILNWIKLSLKGGQYLSPEYFWVPENLTSKFLKSFNWNQENDLEYFEPYNQHSIRLRHAHRYLYHISLNHGKLFRSWIEKSQDSSQTQVNFTRIPSSISVNDILLLPSEYYGEDVYRYILKAQNATYISFVLIRMFHSIFKTSPEPIAYREQQSKAWIFFSEFWMKFPFHEMTEKDPPPSFYIKEGKKTHKEFVVHRTIYYFKVHKVRPEISVAWNLLSLWLEQGHPILFGQVTEKSGEIVRNLKFFFNLLLFFSSPKTTL